MSLCPCREIINVTLPMSDGEGAFLFALRDLRAAPMNAGGPFYAENKMGIRYFYRLQIL